MRESRAQSVSKHAVSHADGVSRRAKRRNSRLRTKRVFNSPDKNRVLRFQSTFPLRAYILNKLQPTCWEQEWKRKD
jgi:muconolactone delta-isomerase